MRASKDKLRAIQHHTREINRHKKALLDIGVYPKKYKLPCKIAFTMFTNHPYSCRKCGRSKLILVAYKSNLMCSRCTFRKYGPMQTVNEWELV